MADFNFFLNRQGIQGRKGEKGDTGFSPTISVGTDTLDEYKLIIANESNSFETPNLRGNINIQDNGGTYLRYDTETKQISAQNMDAATADTLGGVRLSTEADIVEMGAGSVITPSDVADALPLYLEGEGAVTITQDELTSKTKIKVDVPSVNDLESRMSTAEAEIADIQTDVANLNNDKVAKTDLATTNSAGIVKVDGTSITVTEDGTISASSSGALPIASTTQLGGVKVDGTSIIADENGVISSVGGGGAGDVTASGNNVFTGNNKFKKNVTIDCDSSSGNALILRDSWADPYTNYATLRMDNSGDLTIDSEAGGLILDTYLHKSKIDMTKNGDIYFTSEKPLMHRNFQGSGTDVPLVNQENIKAGENITLNKNAETGDITISSTGGGGGTGDVPIATTTTAGKVKPDGTTITVTDDGTISAVGGGAGDVTAAGNNTFTGTNTFNSYVNFNNGFNTTGTAYLRSTNYVDNGSHYFQYISDSLSMNMPIKCNNSYVLTQDSLVEGDGITLTNTSQGVQISATGGGGGSTPTNMVTTDSDQTINGTKIFANGTGTTFTGTSSNSNSLTIDGDDKEIRFNSANQSDAVIKNQGWNSTNLNIGTNFNSVKITTTLYDKNGNEITGGGGTGDVPIATTETAGKVKPDGTTITVTEDGTISAVPTTPTNMVTTDTSQTITGAKTFTEPTVFNNTLNMSTANTDTLYIYATGSYAEGYTTDIKYHKNLNIKGNLSGGAITLAPNNGSLNALKYKNSDNASNPSYDILHTGNLVPGNGITISEPNSTGVRTISATGGDGSINDAITSTTTTYSSSKIEEQLAGKASVKLDNLSEVGEKHFLNKQQITNCLLEVPQRIKLELNDGTLILKAGSQVIVPNGFEADGTTPKFDYVVISEDKSQKTTYNANCLCFCNIDAGLVNHSRDICLSGSTQPTSGQVWYNTTSNKILVSSDNGQTWAERKYSLPIAVTVATTNGVTSIDQVFNGMGYIGSTVWVDKGVKGLIPNGRNEDGSLNNIEYLNSEFKTYDNSSIVNTSRSFVLKQDGTFTRASSYEVNNDGYLVNSDGVYTDGFVCGDIVFGSNSITSFKPKLPFRAVDYNDKSTISGWAFPSTRYVDLTLGASGSKYTAPANGWLILRKTASASGQYLQIQTTINTIIVGEYLLHSASAKSVGITIPMSKGATAGIFYDFGGTTNRFRFVYAEGEK